MNIVATIPKSRFKTYELAERTLRRCDGETDWGEELGSAWLWFIRTNHLPKKMPDVCYMTYDGKIRGYFHVIETSTAQKWIDRGYLLEDKPSQYVLVLAHWHSLPKSEQINLKGFQGWHYTHLNPLQ